MTNSECKRSCSPVRGQQAQECMGSYHRNSNCRPADYLVSIDRSCSLALGPAFCRSAHGSTRGHTFAACRRGRLLSHAQLFSRRCAGPDCRFSLSWLLVVATQS